MNFVQSKYTAFYYQLLIRLAVQSPEGLQKWTTHVTGVAIDGRGVSESKENPDISFEYEQGYSPPALNSQSQKKLVPQLRSLATGGTLPANQAPKIPREQARIPAAAGAASTAGPSKRVTRQHGHETPPTRQAPPQAGRMQLEGTPDHGNLVFLNSPLGPPQTPAIQKSQYYSTIPPGPPTPAAEKSINNHIQVSASGNKLRSRDPRAVEKTRGVDKL